MSNDAGRSVKDLQWMERVMNNVENWRSTAHDDHQECFDHFTEFKPHPVVRENCIGKCRLLTRKGSPSKDSIFGSHL